jgi:acetyl/propionyl-CoA carboxylase alpha subunit
MRVVEAESDLEASLEAAAREAQAAFGDGRVFLEKYLARPRHIEIQLLADDHGQIVALGERECSIQRRHQKLIEESPAPGLSDALRDRIIEAALRLARDANYRNAGTAEFLVDGDQFYFLEVNARLQVEHPVTEIRFARDLVADQLTIAAGDHVVEPVAPRYSALECRVNAEDAAHDFRPATGIVLELNLPGGPAVRVDTQLALAAQISPFYDSLLAKVICWGNDREQARHRMLGALDEFSLLGVHSTAAFLRDVVASAPFARADLSTRFLPEFFPHWQPDETQLKAALLAAALAAEGKTSLVGGGLATRPQNGHASSAVSDSSPISPWTTLGGFEPWSRR